MREAEVLDQALNALCLFQWVEVFALHVFDQRHCRSRLIIDLFDHHRHFGESGQLRCTEAALAGNDLVRHAVRAMGDGTHQQGLQQSLRTN